MPVRPTKVTFDSGTEGWDAAVRDNTDIVLDGPFPIFRATSFAALTSGYLADEYEHCFALTEDTGTLYLSDGVSWNASVAGPGLTELAIDWAFRSSATASGTYYCGGFYDHAALDNDFSPGPVNLGTANGSYAAHVYFVLGAVTTDELTLRVTGTSITDAGARVTSDTEDIVIPDASAVDSYFETTKKFIGQVGITVQSGTAKTCNYGFAKHWDNFNKDFTVVALEATWLSGSNDPTANLRILHHKFTGWTFNSGATATPPAPIASLQGSHVTEFQTINGESGAWKITGLSVPVEGSGSEGILVEITAGANRTFELGNLQIVINY